MIEGQKIIQAILLDIDDVIWPTSIIKMELVDNSLRIMLDAGLHIDSNGKEITFEEAKSLYMEIYRRNPNSDTQFNDLCIAIKGYEDHAIVSAGVDTHRKLKPALMRPTRNLINFLMELKIRHCEKLGAISTGEPDYQVSKLNTLGVLPFFREYERESLEPGKLYVYASTDPEKSKPSVYLLEQSIKEMGFDPRYAIMIGDRPDKDLVPAKQLEMTTIRWTRGKYSVHAIDFLIKKALEEKRINKDQTEEYRRLITPDYESSSWDLTLKFMALQGI